MKTSMLPHENAAHPGPPPIARDARPAGPVVLVLVLHLLLVSVASSCARVQPPPGWAPDRRPPQLVSTQPAQLAIVPSWKGPVVFRFDERISEKGLTEQTAIVSPDSGALKVSKKGDEVRVMPRGGWRPGRIYHVVLLPTIADMFGNTRTAPAELTFSTGPAIPQTVVAGVLRDRLTGRVTAGALVQAVHLPDSLAYVTASDTAGFFAIRHVPEGRYEIWAFEDRSRDRRRDFREPQGHQAAELAPPRDTLLVPEIALLAGDSTPARLTKAQPRDSIVVTLTFDDYLDPTRSLGYAAATLWRMPDSVLVPGTRLMFPRVYEASLPKPKVDSTATAGAANARPPAPGAARAPGAPGAPGTGRPVGGPGGPGTGEVADTTPRPVQELVLVASQPLAPRTRYRVIVTRVPNLNGLAGGGGTATFETARPPARDSARAGRGGAADTAKAPARPGAISPTPKAPRDTTRAPRDTTREPRPAAPRAASTDTIRAPTQATPRPATPPDTTRSPVSAAVPGRREPWP